MQYMVDEHYTRTVMMENTALWGPDLSRLALRRLSLFKQHRQLRARVLTTKFVFGLLATEAEMAKRNKSRNPICNLDECSLEEKQTNWHVFAHCTSAVATKARREWANKMQKAIYTYMSAPTEGSEDDKKGDRSTLDWQIGDQLLSMCQLSESAIDTSWSPGTCPPSLSIGDLQGEAQMLAKEVSSVGAFAWWHGVWSNRMHDLLVAGGLSPRRANKALFALTAEHRAGWVGVYRAVLNEQHKKEHDARAVQTEEREREINIQVREIHARTNTDCFSGPAISVEERIRTWSTSRKEAWVNKVITEERRVANIEAGERAPMQFAVMRATPRPSACAHQPSLAASHASARRSRRRAKYKRRRVIDDGDSDNEGERLREQQTDRAQRAAQGQATRAATAATTAMCVAAEARAEAEREQAQRTRAVAARARAAGARKRRREAQLTAEEKETARARERRAQARQQAAAEAAERRGLQRTQQQQRQQRQMKAGLAQSGLAWFFSAEAMVVFGTRKAAGSSNGSKAGERKRRSRVSEIADEPKGEGDR